MNVILEEHIVDHPKESLRIYDYLPGKLNIITTRKGIKKALQKGRVLVNKKRAYSGDYIYKGDCIQLLELKHLPHRVYTKAIEVLYEDDFCAVVLKPAGMIVSGNQFKTLQNTLPFNLKESKVKDKLPWPLPIHRLDAQTSGLVIIAKTYAARIKLGQLLENKMIYKRYNAIVQGYIQCQGTLNRSINGKSCLTHFKSLKTQPNKRNGHLTLLDLVPVTGRTHQLRIHLSGIGCPILGDKRYGEKGNTLKHKGLFLCAVEVSFNHPMTDKKINVSIQMPSKFNRFLPYE